MAYISVDVDLDEFGDEEMCREMRRRGHSVTKLTKPEYPHYEIVINIFVEENPKVCLFDTIEIEKHLKQVLRI